MSSKGSEPYVLVVNVLSVRMDNVVRLDKDKYSLISGSEMSLEHEIASRLGDEFEARNHICSQRIRPELGIRLRAGAESGFGAHLEVVAKKDAEASLNSRSEPCSES